MIEALMDAAGYWPRMSTSIYCGQESMEGKVVIVTGANSGLGFETAKEMARRGARVILGCRNIERGMKAQDAIIEETGNCNVCFKQIDLEVFESVRYFAFDVLYRESRLDVLINNAGVSMKENLLTEDNLPIEAQVNYFGPFLLTLILIPLLRQSSPSRIINVASNVHYIGHINLDKFVQPATTRDGHRRVYADTKLAVAMFTIKLSEVLQETGVTVNCLHPGLVMTDLYKGRFSLSKELRDKAFKDVWEGSQTAVFLAVAQQVQNVTGKFFMECFETRYGDPANNRNTIDKLWEMSQRRVQYRLLC